ncbi:MAG: choice-of-anchor D domain-containing protein [Alphaproteobacteria bacterium]|nr:choice-of-anchor D domain-containing protein [Alphaproteobacteria bacterium]MCB9791996.1 choice-of-anchor D domain-containing protein [Alphaproteobacteria bacterium]
MRNLSILFALFATVGCTEYVVDEVKNDQGEIEDNAQPDIEVDPVEINFGQLAVGDGGSISEVVTVSNVGDGELHIFNLELDDPSAPFTVGAIESVLVPPGQATTFIVTFSPETAANNSATVLINSDDPDESVAEVQLNGSGIAPIIEVTPQEFDFGTLYIGCDNQQSLTISNIGNDVLIVDEFQANTASQDFYFEDGYDTYGELPWEIEPGQSVEVWVDYAPLDEYQDIQYLTVLSNDPLTPAYMATQSGNGELYGENTDVFEQPINGATDILFAVDWSCSMYDDLTNVENNFESFVTTLASMDADYHVAVVTADNGCFNGAYNYIDNSYSEADQQSIFSTMLNGSYGSNTERAFMLLEASLQSSNIGSGGCNEGFYREDATLSLVGVTDEPEQSVNPYSYYVSLFQAMKSNSDDVVIHAIAGDYPTGCGSASAGTGLYEATVATGGLFLSICATDFGSHLEALAEGSAADLTSFELSDFPVPTTITVIVDSIQINTGWEYNEVDNAIQFDDDSVPEGGSIIEVDYALLGDCEA